MRIDRGWEFRGIGFDIYRMARLVRHEIAKTANTPMANGWVPRMADSRQTAHPYDEVMDLQGDTVMAVSHLPDKPNLPGIAYTEMPAFNANKKTEMAVQIANHLKTMLKVSGTGCPASLRVPSALELSGFYHCSILEVLDGLFELKKQHYEYVMNGLDAEIILHDPLCRKKPDKRLRLVPHGFLQAWNSIQKTEGT